MYVFDPATKEGGEECFHLSKIRLPAVGHKAASFHLTNVTDSRNTEFCNDSDRSWLIPDPLNEVSIGTHIDPLY